MLVPTMHLHRRGRGLTLQVSSQVRLTKSPATRLLLHPGQLQCLHMHPRLVPWGVTLPLLWLIRRHNSHTAGRPRTPCILQTPIRLFKVSKAPLDPLPMAAESRLMLLVESASHRTLLEEIGAQGELEARVLQEKDLSEVRTVVARTGTEISSVATCH